MTVQSMFRTKKGDGVANCRHFRENVVIESPGWSKQMTQEARIERRRLVARRVFDALCARYPHKYIALVQPGHTTAERADDMIATKAADQPPPTMA